jgi:hypothetical protein
MQGGGDDLRTVAAMISELAPSLGRSCHHAGTMLRPRL